MSSETIIYLMLGGMAGGFINGFAGTGTALFALGFFLSVLEPLAAVAIVALMSTLTGLQGVYIVRHELFANKARLFRFILPGLIGGSVIIESIFAWPGMGRMAYEAILARDYPVILTVNFISAVLVLAGLVRLLLGMKL